MIPDKIPDYRRAVKTIKILCFYYSKNTRRHLNYLKILCSILFAYSRDSSLLCFVFEAGSTDFHLFDMGNVAIG